MASASLNPEAEALLPDALGCWAAFSFSGAVGTVMESALQIFDAPELLPVVSACND